VTASAPVWEDPDVTRFLRLRALNEEKRAQSDAADAALRNAETALVRPEARAA
jgi:hypothetical protein